MLGGVVPDGVPPSFSTASSVLFEDLARLDCEKVRVDLLGVFSTYVASRSSAC
jgi:hypothetical protein